MPQVATNKVDENEPVIKGLKRDVLVISEHGFSAG